MTDNTIPVKTSATKAWVAGGIGVALAALWVYQPAVAVGAVGAETHLNAVIAALVSFGALFGGTYAAPNKPIAPVDKSGR